ncbi:MAG: glycosyltransferase family 2 protein [Nitrospinota bacterium]
MSVSIVIPAFNEARSIPSVLEEIKRVLAEGNSQGEVIVVDDGSSDGTADVIERLGHRVIRHDGNRGYGAAIKTGISHASGEMILITDADGTYPMEAIPRLIEEMKDAEMVVGARVGRKAKIPMIRRLAKWALTMLANYLAETRIPDLNSGFRIFRKHIAENYHNILPSGFSFTGTITLAMHIDGFRVKYLPIEYHGRLGSSKFRPLADTFNYLVLIVRTITFFNPLRVFLPLGFLLFFLGIATGLYSLLALGRLADVTTVVLLVSSVQIFLLGILADVSVRRNR